MTQQNPNVYGGMDEAKGEGRFPFFSEKGRYVCAIVGWKGRVTRNAGPADFCDFKILKTDNPDQVPVGTHRTRMRSIKGDSAGPALEEIKARALVAFASKGLPMQAKDITQQVMGKIADEDGGLLKGSVVVVEIGDKVKTKTGKDFSPANYFVPTPRDLEGVDLG